MIMEIVVAIKLLNGDDVIGKLVSNKTDNTIITLEDPRVMMPTQNGLGLVPLMIANPDAEVSINRSAISVNEISVVGELEKAYLQQVSKLDLTMMR